jgi:hypothetical protein
VGILKDRSNTVTEAKKTMLNAWIEPEDKVNLERLAVEESTSMGNIVRRIISSFFARRVKENRDVQNKDGNSRVQHS